MENQHGKFTQKQRPNSTPISSQLELPNAEAKASEYDLELVTCRFNNSAVEQLRPPKIVRIGIFQHKLPLPPNSPIKEVRDGLFKLAEKAIETAALGGVNVFCFQEAWSIFFFNFVLFSL